MNTTQGLLVDSENLEYLCKNTKIAYFLKRFFEGNQLRSGQLQRGWFSEVVEVVKVSKMREHPIDEDLATLLMELQNILKTPRENLPSICSIIDGRELALHSDDFFLKRRVAEWADDMRVKLGIWDEAAVKARKQKRAIRDCLHILLGPDIERLHLRMQSALITTSAQDIEKPIKEVIIELLKKVLS